MQHEIERPERRRALKAAGGVVAAAVVWSEPTIKGLARRPAYANVASGDGQNCAFEPGTYMLTNGCVTVNGAEICAVKVTPGNNFRVELSGGCTWDTTIANALAIRDNQGDEELVNLTAGSSNSSLATTLNGNVASAIIVVPAGVTFSCP